MSNFAKHAVVAKDGTELTSEQRKALALTEPNNPNAMTQTQVKAVTQNRIRNAMSELAHGNIENVQRWLMEVGEGKFIEDAEGKKQCVVAPNPKAAIELFMELAQYSLPKLKSVAIDVSNPNTDARELSLAELQRIVSEQ